MAVHELLGKPVPFLRWSFLRMMFGIRTLFRDWQVGDGREEEAARFVMANAPAGNIDAAIEAIDQYAYQRKFLMNIGDKKGTLIDQAIERVQARRVLELGAYIGYSALRIARLLPAGGHLYSVEFNAANAEISRRIIAHAGAADRVTFVTGSLGDGGKTLDHLARLIPPGSLDLVFIDHDKNAYLPDLQRILDHGWLRPGGVVIADNVRFPGAPAYKSYMDEQEGKRWTTRAHLAQVEYQSVIPDVVLESTLLG
jgi:catechol O-methyltransferase